MNILHRAVIWTFLAGVGMAPLAACGQDNGERRTEVRESSIPKSAPRDGRTPGSLTPNGLMPVEKPSTGGDGSLTPGAGGLVPVPRDESAAAPDPAETETDTKRPADDLPRTGTGEIRTRTVSLQADGVEIIGTLTEPAGETRMLVVMLHGYTGNRAEVRIPSAGEGIFERAARRFAEAGIASYRFDFAGSGQSGGSWRDTTFGGQARDAAAVVRNMRDRQGFGSVPIAALGFSQGGLVALKAAAEGLPVSRIALWNPVLDPKRTYGKILGASALRDGLRLAQAGDTGTIVGTSRLEAGFFADVHATRPIDDAALFSGPIQVVSGSRDSVAADGPGLARQLSDARGGRSTELVVLTADHGFNAQRGTGQVDAAIDRTLAFMMAGATR